MPKSVRTPSYRHFKPRNLAVVTIDGRDIYLGPYDSPESKAEYDRLIAEWLANGRRLPQADPGTGVTVNELILSFWPHAEKYYRRADGTQTNELTEFRLSLRPLRELYGHTEAAKFGPLALKAIRQKIIESGLCRNVVNHRVGRVKRMFNWAVENELVPPSLVHGLKEVRGLKRGRCDGTKIYSEDC